MMIFYLGTHMPAWLAQAKVPLFVSDATLKKVRRLPRASSRWSCDSAGFMQIAKHGTWTVSAAEYAARVRRYRDEIGNLDWAAIQDWMCEPDMLKKTGLSVREHQARTIASLVELRSIAPDLPWAPVLQGWCPGDYWDCLDAYAAAGIDLLKEPIVGIGSVCRRQHTLRSSFTIRELAEAGLRLHGFGYKVQGLQMSGPWLTSGDSLAWSFQARLNPPLDGHDQPGPGRTKGHQSCANCLDYALLWRHEMIEKVVTKSSLVIET